jgi:hypothetical protein
LAAYRGVAGGALVLGEIVTDEINGPAVFNRAEVAGAVG